MSHCSCHLPMSPSPCHPAHGTCHPAHVTKPKSQSPRQMSPSPCHTASCHPASVPSPRPQHWVSPGGAAGLCPSAVTRGGRSWLRIAPPKPCPSLPPRRTPLPHPQNPPQPRCRTTRPPPALQPPGLLTHPPSLWGSGMGRGVHPRAPLVWLSPPLDLWGPPSWGAQPRENTKPPKGTRCQGRGVSVMMGKNGENEGKWEISTTKLTKANISIPAGGSRADWNAKNAPICIFLNRSR